MEGKSQGILKAAIKLGETPLDWKGKRLRQEVVYGFTGTVPQQGLKNIWKSHYLESI